MHNWVRQRAGEPSIALKQFMSSALGRSFCAGLEVPTTEERLNSWALMQQSNCEQVFRIQQHFTLSVGHFA